MINIDTPDVDAAARFYGEALGLKETRRLFAGRIVEMTLDGQLFHILPKDEGEPAFPLSGEPRRYARHWTPLHLDFVVPDIETAMARVLNAGAAMERPLVRHVWGAIAGFADPFGHGFCLIELSARGYDAVAD